MKERDQLELYFMKTTLDTMSKNHKIAYKHCLGAIFINLISGRGWTSWQNDNYKILEGVKSLPRKGTDFEEITKRVASVVYPSLGESHFLKPYNTTFFDKIINFTRVRLRELKDKDNSLFQASELVDIIDLKSFFGHKSVEKHHWIDFDLRSGLVLTLPEAIIFHDLKVHWNEFVRLVNSLNEEQSKHQSRRERFEYAKSEPAREKFYKRSAAARTLIFLCVSFVESYLLNLFYTIKEGDVPEKGVASGMLAQSRIEDQMIVEGVIYKMFPSFKASLDEMYKAYKLTNNFRNRYVHASPFIDTSTNISHLQPLLAVNDDVVIESLQNSLDFVRTLDRLLPDNLKLLFWWYDEEIISLRDMQPMKLTNKDSRFDQLSYE